MHELIRYIDDTMQEYEDKVARGGDLSSKDVVCIKDLAKTKMAILTNEAMEESDYGYSREGYSREGDMNNGYSGRGRMYSNGYMGRYSRDNRGRGSDANRDSMGRYSSRGYSYADAKEDMIAELKDLAKKAPDEKTRQEIEHFANEMQSK